MTTARMCVAVLGLACSAAQAGSGPANLVTNGNFEDGLTGWDMVRFLTPTQKLGSLIEGLTSLSGDNCQTLYCADVYGSGARIRQSVATVPGAAYDFSLSTRSTYGSGKVTVFWDGLLVGSYDVAAGPVMNLTLPDLLASGAGTTFEVHVMNANAGVVSLDNIMVQPVAAMPVPEAGTAAMFVAGLGLIGFAACRQRAAPRFT